ncbi:hypothetical protein ACLO87_15670 [Paenalcaligenes sp. Me52]|uniref:hypothetical protein n=1 Tax=Paenalcaligenes sp. Me52 TaxID=3392038 RepID=UPI003D2688A0
MTRRKRSDYPIGGRFCALPHKVMDCAAFVSLSGAATRLLLEILRTYNGNNNGQMYVTLGALKGRGWNSGDVFTRARQELQDKGFIQMTRLPLMPRRGAWFGLTWRPLDYTPEMDLKPVDFLKDAFLLWEKKTK